MTDSLTLDLINHSVTGDDTSPYRGNGVVTFLIPWFMMGAANLPLPADLPPYWTLNLGIARYWSRDMIMRSTILHEDFWAGAVAKATAKQSAKSFEVKGRGAARWQEMFLQWGGDGYVPSMQRNKIDWLCTNNGAFYEIVRVSNAAGSRIIGLVHLDSLRCIRTGDPEQPVAFVDLKGKYHTLRDYQVIEMVDQPDPSSASLGIGHCAAERAYHQIYKLSAIEQYLREKVTGTGANTLYLISGLNASQLQGFIDTAKQSAEAKGMTYYQGNILGGLLAQVEPKLLTIPLRNLPDGFDREKELEVAQLAYSNALYMDVNEINPRLMPRGALGMGHQADVLEEKQHQSGQAAYDKQLIHNLMLKVLPAAVTFTFNERDWTDEQNKANVSLAREQMLNSKVLNGQLTPSQALQYSIEQDDLPREFLPLTTAPDSDQPIGDEERTEADEGASQNAVIPPATPPQPQAAQQPQPTKQVKEQTRSDLATALEAQTQIKELRELKDSIDRTREALLNA